MAQAPTIAVLTRAPSAEGKRRVFDALRMPTDPALLTALLLDTLDGVLATGFRVLVGVDPATAVDEVRALLPPEVEVVAQGEGDLGDRMRGLMHAAFTRGASAVIVVGSDLPDLSPDVLREAARLLGDRPGTVVLGPAVDGGYYLVAAGAVPDIFTGIEWGSARVLRQTEAAAAQAGLACRYVATMNDVDEPSDLALVRARRTRAWVNQARASGQRF